MKNINIQINLVETVDGFRVDCLDLYNHGDMVRLNPETKEEAFSIIRRYLKEKEGTKLEVI